MHETLITAVLIYLALGIGAGMLSGLLGAGGGLVMVPGLMFLFHLDHTVNPAFMMHVAVGTSLASMIPITVRSLLSHLKRGVVFFAVYQKMLAGLLFGVLAGSVLAHFIHSIVLQVTFGLFVLTMAYALVRKQKDTVVKKLPGKWGSFAAGSLTGALTGLLGIGGSTYSVPFMVNRGVDMRVAVVTAIAFALTSSCIGAIIFMMTGMHVIGLPHWTIGYVLWPAWLGLSVGGIVIAPLGAKISHQISPQKLKIIFAIFLLFVSAHMLWV